MTKKISFEDACILNAVRFLRFWARLLPLGAVVALGRGMGLAAYALSKRRDVARRNLRAAFADRLRPRAVRRLARRSFMNLGASFGEMLKIPDMDAAYLERHLTIEGRETFERHASSGKGAIILTAHFGSWELLNIAAGLLGHPLTVLARIQKHPRSDEYLNRLRASKGATVVFKGMMLRQLVRALKDGSIVAMLIDQDGGRRGVFVDLFGRRSSTPPGAAQFALTTGSPIFCAFIRRTGFLDHRIVVDGPLESPPAGLDDAEKRRFLLQQFTHKLERAIREAPDQWLWAHRRWKSTPDRWVVLLSDGKAGHRTQSEAVLESIRRERAAAGNPEDSLHVRRVEMRYRSRRRLSALKAFGLLARRAPAALLKWALEPDSAEALFSSYADIVVSCGSSLVDPHLWLKRENGARSVVVMKPYRALDEFDAVVAPRHDGLGGRGNVFPVDGAVTLYDAPAAEEAGRKLRAELNLDADRPVVSVFAGGDAGAFRYEEKAFRGFLEGISSVSRESGAVLVATSSRRTPLWAEAAMREILTRNPRVKLLVLANETNRPGIAQAMMGLAWAHLVSGESVSMLSEAVSSGKPVGVFFPGDRTKIKNKFRRFLEAMGPGGIREWNEPSLERLRELLSGAAGRPGAGPDALSSAARKVSA